MKQLKKLSLTLALLITAAAGAWAQGPWTSGSCTVTLSNGTLTVSGNGAMADYQFFSDRPWHNNINDITSVVVESGVTTVGRYAFFNFGNMTSVTLPEGLTAIGVSAFRVCGKLTSVTIPSTVTSIGNDAFYDCAGMTDVNLYADPANLTWDDNNDDFKENKATQCHVLAEHLSAYQTKFNGSVRVTFVGDLEPLPGTMTLDDTKTTASFTMPASDVTVNYTLVRDMQDTENPVAFSGLPTTTTAPIIVKKGDDGKYQPIETLTIQLIDPLAAEDAKNIIAADGITVKVLVGNDGTPIEYDQENPITLEAFLADMKPGYYWIKAEPKDATSPYDGTVYSSEFTVVEQYDLTVKPANDFSKNGLENVTVGSEQPITPDANGEATKTGIAPNTNVKIKATRGYIIEKVEAKKKAAPRPLAEATAADLGKIAGADGNIYDTKADAEAVATGNAVAMIAYVGTASDCAHGLAIALADESGTKNYEAAGTACSGKAAVTGGTWRLPSIKDWQYMLIGCGASESYKDNPSTMSYSGLASMLTTAQGNALVQGVSYWSSTGYTADNAWRLYINGSIVNFTLEYKGNNRQVRACLAF